MNSRKMFTALALAAAGLLSCVSVQAATYRLKTETHYVREDGKWVQEYKDTNNYNKKGYLTGWKTVMRRFDHYDNDKKKNVYKTESSEMKYTYDSKGRITKQLHYENNKETGRYVSVYSKNSETMKMWENNKYSGKMIYKFTRAGQLKTSTQYNKNNKLVSVGTYSYDKKGNRTRIVMKDAKGKVTSTTVYKNTYKSGKLVKTVITGSDYKNTYTYYSNGVLKSLKNEGDGYTWEERYDSKGRMTYDASITDSSSQIRTYKNGMPVKETSSEIIEDENGKKRKAEDTFTFKCKSASGRITEYIKYTEKNEAVEKVTYTYVKTK